METKEKNLQDDLMESAHRIWLAGLGALAAAEEEGSKIFTRLVERGRDVEARGKTQVDDVKTRAGEAWGGVGEKFDAKLTDALHRLGVPTREEIRALTQKVEELTNKVELLKPRVTPATPAPPAPPAVTEPQKVTV